MGPAATGPFCPCPPRAVLCVSAGQLHLQHDPSADRKPLPNQTMELLRNNKGLEKNRAFSGVVIVVVDIIAIIITTTNTFVK